MSDEQKKEAVAEGGEAKAIKAKPKKVKKVKTQVPTGRAYIQAT